MRSVDFSKEHNIRLVIPFTSKDDEVFNNPSIYQINTPQSYLHSEVFDHFTRQFPNANLIILDTTDGRDQYKKEFLEGLDKDTFEKKGDTITHTFTKKELQKKYDYF